MIEVTVRLPGNETYVLDIKRIAGEGTEDSLNRYRAWLLGRSVDYDHRYGDGWVLCVERALSALSEIDPG